MAVPDAGAARRERTAPAAWALGALVVLALAMRLPRLGAASLWWDECATLQAARAVAQAGAGATARALLRGLSGYFILLAPWAGPHTPEWLLRLPSVLAGAALVPVGWGLGAHLGGRRLAWRLALATALSPFLVWHAREARWYPLTWLLAGLALLDFLEALRCPAARPVLGCLAWGLLAAITFPPAAVPLGVQGGWLALRGLRRGGRKGRPSSLPVAAKAFLGLLGALAGAWLWETLIGPGLRSGAAGFGFRNLGGPRPAAVAYTAVTFATGYSLGPGPAEWHARPLAWPAPAEAGVLLAGVLILVLLAGAGLRWLRREGKGREAAALCALAAAPILAGVAAALWTGHRYAPRHAGLACLPTLALAAAGTLSRDRIGRLGVALGLGLAALQGVSVWNLVTSPRYQREAVRPAARWVAHRAGEGDLVLVFGGLDLPWRHYYDGPAPWRAVYVDDPATWNPASLRALVERAPAIFLVRGLLLGGPEEEPLLEAVTSAGSLRDRARFPGVEVEILSGGSAARDGDGPPVSER